MSRAVEGEEDGLRRSKRLLGDPPEVYSTPLLREHAGAGKQLDHGAAGHQSLENLIREAALSTTGNSTRKSIVSKASSSRSEAIRQRIQAEIDSMQRVSMAEEEVFKIAKQRLEREKQIETKRIQVEQLRAEEEQEVSDNESQILEDVPEAPQMNSNESVADWLGAENQNQQQHQVPRQYHNDMNEMTMNSRLNKLLARQSVPRDLPFFGGEPEEWPMFIQQFRRSTELCGLSSDENMMRLQKCLKNKARDAVLPILGIPENLDRVLETLELLFGRTDQIIKSMIMKVKAAPAPSKSKTESIILFANTVANLVATMRNLRRTNQMFNPQLLEELVSKLPVEQQFQWCAVAKNLKEEPSLDSFHLWLSDLALTASMMPTTNVSINEKPWERKKENKKPSFVAVAVESKKCLHCSSSGHKLEECQSFIDADLQTKWKTVKASKICFCCLIPGHKSSDCRKKIPCGTDGCEKIHHKTLHKNVKSENSKPEANSENLCGHVNSNGEKSEVLLKILPVKLFGPKGMLSTYAMLDEGSTITMVDSEVADILELDGSAFPLCMKWTNGLTREEADSRKVSVQISGLGNTKRFSLQNVRTVRNLSLPIQTVDMKRLKERWPYLEDIPFNSLVNAQPLILIGSDNLLLSMGRKFRQGHWNDPVATKTWLGWVVSGNLPRSMRVDSAYSFHVCEQKGEDDLTMLIKATFSTESFGVKLTEEKCRSQEDQLALEIMKTTTRKVGERYETGLLWKNPNVILPESRTNALRRLHCMERKMDKDPTFADAYCSKIEDYLLKGYCRKLNLDEAKMRNQRTYYLPHFGVFNPNKPGKLRLVMDAASQSHGVSLNDCLLKGPDLLTPLPAVLMRFRRHRVGFVGDIREMFHQILISPADADSQRFLWRGKERSKEPDEYVMQVVIFGAACSPSSALYVKNLNAVEHQKEFPEASRSAIQNTYMDDNIHGSTDDAAAAKQIADTVELFDRADFYICNWSSSSRKAVESLPQELRAKNLVDLSEELVLPTERVLGLHWDPEEDQFVFKLNFPRVKAEILSCARVPTKREMASLVMSVFDPLGLVTHFTIKGRIIFQEAWLLNSGWDEKISDELFKQWKWWVQELQQIVNVRVPRCYSYAIGEATNIQLHVFVDASEKAFAAVAYLRVQTEEKVDVAIVLAKARVAPLKALTIPKLELQAALMGSRLAQTVKAEIQVPIHSTTYWSDSQTVIAWIRSHSKNPRQFVAHRIGEILESSDVVEWRWVPTQENVSDEATRPTAGTQFDWNCRWYVGPAFLRLPESSWPREKTIDKVVIMDETSDCNEFVAVVIGGNVNRHIPYVKRFTSWLKLVRATAWELRFIWNFSSKKRGELRRRGELTWEEIREAQVVWWKAVQSCCFYEDLKFLRRGQPVRNQSKLRFLSPMLDKSGVIRLRSRLAQATDLQFGTRNPVILDPSHRFTQLLLKHLHEQAAHQGIEAVLNELRRDYWVLRGRAAVKRAFYDCSWCRRRKAQPILPEMGMLPDERVLRPECPFTYTGLDFFGPFMVTIQRKQVKRYGAIFTCLSTRAIHLEVAADLSTDSAINVIRRFIARRTVPEVLLSDNGTNFHGADKAIRQAVQAIDKDEILRRFSGKGMTWRFNPPASPHMGGAWERLVRSVKVALSATLKEIAPKEDVLHTLFTEAEFIVNNRPLTHVSVDPEDLQCLTPNHFLRCGLTRDLSLGVHTEKNINLRSQWKLVQALTEKLWSRWVKEYLPTLARRTKWFQWTKPIKVGDVVVVADKDGPRNTWPLGRIINVYPGKDGQVRVVDVRTKDGTYRRPAAKICPLEVTKCDEESSPSSGGRKCSGLNE